MTGFGMPKKKQGSGKFKPKLIGSVIGVAIFGAIALYSGVNMLTGNSESIDGVAYDMKGDLYLFVFAVAFGGGFGYWGFANMLERKKVKADRQRKKDEGKSNKHKKGDNNKK